MKFAIIAAGEGSRLQKEGAALPKPLTPLNGQAMIDRLIQIFMKNNAESIVIIINSQSELLKKHIEQLSATYPIELVIKDTPSSMHSFYELSRYLRGNDFCLTTVDTIFYEDDFEKYIKAFQSSSQEGMMAVTDYIDDEKPLYVAVNDKKDIIGFHDVQEENDQYISGGIYCLKDSALDVLEKCMSEGVSRMRNFQRALISNKLPLEAYLFSKIIDVDHVDDIQKAEHFLAERL